MTIVRDNAVRSQLSIIEKSVDLTAVQKRQIRGALRNVYSEGKSFGLREAEKEISEKWDNDYWQEVDSSTVEVILPDIFKIFKRLHKEKE